jgi:hypothetical protein
MSESDNEGKIELAVRVLGNELIAFRMIVDDFKMKWLIVGIASIIAIGWAATLFGPMLATTFGG